IRISSPDADAHVGPGVRAAADTQLARRASAAGAPARGRARDLRRTRAAHDGRGARALRAGRARDARRRARRALGEPRAGEGGHAADDAASAPGRRPSALEVDPRAGPLARAVVARLAGGDA